MQIIIPRHELRDAVAGLSKVVPRKATLPVLQQIRLAAHQGRTSLTATDLDHLLEYRCAQAQIQTEGDALVPLDELTVLTKGPADDNIEIKATGDSLEITNTVAGQRLTRRLSGTPSDEWPALPPKPDVGIVDPALLGNLRKAAPFASQDQSRPILGGLYLDSHPKGDYVVATDGRRMSAFNTVNHPFRTGCIVPASKFLLWNKLNPTELLVGHKSDSQSGWFRLVTPRWDYQVQTIAGTYPGWRQVVPTEAGVNALTISDADAALLAKVLPTFAGHDTSNAGVIFRNQDGSVVVCGKSANDQQETSLRITSSTLERPDARICVARDYLLQALAAGFRAFHFADDESPLYSRDQSGGIHVLMPLRLGEDHPAPTAETTPPAPEPATAPPPVPVEPAAADSATPRPAKTESKKEKKIMPKPEKDATAFDKLLAACEAAKAKLKDANDAVTEILSAAKDVGREDKQRRTEIEQVRAGLAKLQTIKV
jgi:DNA polymerase-3 subunit beta